MAPPTVESAPSASQKPAIQFLTTGTPPPAPLYISKDDKLSVRCSINTNNIHVFINARILLPNGEIIANKWDCFIVTAYAQQTFTFALTEGFLLSITAFSTFSGLPGQNYVEAAISRGLAANPDFGQVLFRGYIAGGHPIGWPESQIRDSLEGFGNLRTITGTDPAAGSEISETITSNGMSRLTALFVNLVTDATAVTRTPEFIIDDGGNVFYRAQTNFGIGASLTGRVSITGGGSLSGTINQQVMAPIPPDLRLQGGWRIRTSTINLQPADNYGPPTYLTEEWIIT